MAGFLGDIVVERGPVPGVIVGQLALGDLHQRHGMAYMMIGLGQIGDIGFARDATLKAVADLGDGGEVGAFGGRVSEQVFKEGHAVSQAIWFSGARTRSA